MDILKSDFGIKKDTFNMIEDSNADIKQSAFVAKDNNPDEYAKAYSVANKFNTTPDFVKDYLPEFEKKSNESEIISKLSKAKTDAPITAEMMSNPVNLSLAQDDIDSLVELEKKRRDYSFASDAYNNLAAATVGVVKGIPEMVSTIPDMLASLDPEGRTVLGSPLFQAGAEEFRKFGRNNSVSNYLNEKQQDFILKSPSAEKNAVDLASNGKFAEAGKTLAVQTIGQVPQLAALIGTSIFAGPAAGLGYAGVSTSTQNFNEDIEGGVNKQTALVASVGKGTIEAAFEGIGSIGFIERTINKVSKQFGKAAAGEVAKSLVENIIKGSAINMTEEGATSLAQDYVSYITGENPNALVGSGLRAANAALIGATTGGVIESPAALMAGIAVSRNKKQVELDQAMYDSLGKGALESKVLNRAPEKFKEFVSEQVKDGPVENVYISREGFKEYAQSKGKTEVELAAEIGISEELNKADESSTEIEVKTAKMASDVVKTEHYAGLRGEVKFKVDGKTEGELRRESEAIKKDLQEQLDNNQKRLTPDREKLIEKEANEVAQNITNKLINDANVSGREAKTNAKVMAEYFKTTSIMFNKTPLEIYNKYGLNFSAVMDDLQNGESDFMSLLSQMDQQNKEVPYASRDENGQLVVDENNLDLLRSRIEQSQAGERLTKKDENGSVIGNISQPSTFPEFAKGYTKKEILTAIDKYKNGEKLTPKQETTLELVYNGMVDKIARREYFQTYRGQHTSPGPDGNIKNRLDDLSETLPDIYSIDEKTALKYYGFHDAKADTDVIKIIQSLKNNPEAEVKIYRAVPENVNQINDGDWVSLTKYYADMHGEGRFDGKYKVVEKTVKAKELYNAGDIQEWGYHAENAFNPYELKQNNRASIQIAGNEFNIKLFKSRNESSIMHEFAHYMLDVTNKLANEDNATPELKEFQAEILKHIGVENYNQVGEKEQELFARSWEAYLMKGEAPNNKLRKLFNYFKTALLNIYKRIAGIEKEAGFKVDISPEMQSIFDRLIATEQEIAEYRNQAPKQIAPQDAMLALLNEKETYEYLNAIELSRMEAEDKLRAKLMQDLIRKSDKAYQSKYNELLNEGMNKAKEFNEFKVMQAIKDNPDLRISSEIADKIDKKYRQYLPKDLFVKDGGLDVQVLAEMFGYPNVGSFLEALLPYRKGIDAWAETYAATNIQKFYPELLQSPELSDEAIKAAHNDNYRLLKKFELEFLAKNYASVVKNATDKLIRRMPKTQAVIQQARNIIASTNVREIKPHVFLNAERKFAAMAAKSFKQGNIEAAFDAKYKEYLNFELYRESVKAKEDVQNSVKKLKENFKRSDEDLAKTRDIDLINAGREILKSYGVITGPKAEVDYLKKVEIYDPESFAGLKALIDVVNSGADNYSNISYNKFVEMNEVMQAVWDLSKSRREIEIDGKRMDKKTVATELAGRIKELTTQDLNEIKKVSDDSGKFKTYLLSLKASLTRVEAWATAMGGNFHKYIYQPIADATAKYRLEKEKYLTKYKSIVDEFLKPQDQALMFETPIISTELNAEFKGKSQLIGALLHTGNESNLSKLLEGRGWAEKNPDGTLNTRNWDAFINRMISEGVLTKQDYDFVQSIWDLFEEMKPDIQKAHKKILGYYMNEITAKPFQNQFGEYRGGYAPAKTDPNSIQGQDIQMKNFVENLGSDASFVFPTTGRGATKTRNELYKAPLSVDLNMVASHIEWATRFAHIEPAARQVLSVIKSSEFSNALHDFDNTLMESMIMPWLDRTVKQTRIEQSKGASGKLLDKVSGFMRRNSATAVMTLNVVNAMEQFGGLSVAATMVKPAKIKLALIDYINNPTKAVEFVMEKSTFMRSTQGSNIYELNDRLKEFLLNPNKYEKIQAFSRKHTYILQTFTQNIVNTTVWIGAYNQSVEMGMTEIEAVRFADSVIRQTQGTNLPEDVSQYETGTETGLLFKQFTGYFNMLANLSESRIKQIAREVGLRKGAGRLFYLYMTLMAVPAAISTALRIGAAGGAADEDEDDSFVDDFLANFFGTQIKTGLASFPFGGQVLVAGFNKFATENQYDDRLSLSPAISILESAVQGPGGVLMDIVNKGEISKKSVKDSLMFIGVLTSTPVGVIGKPVGYIMDVNSGRAEPTGPIDFARGLVTGKPGSQ